MMYYVIICVKYITFNVPIIGIIKAITTMEYYAYYSYMLSVCNIFDYLANPALISECFQINPL